jgi:hypothetical protein
VLRKDLPLERIQQVLNLQDKLAAITQLPSKKAAFLKVKPAALPTDSKTFREMREQFLKENDDEPSLIAPPTSPVAKAK